MDILKLLGILLEYVVLHSRDTLAHHIFVECLPCAKGGRGKPFGCLQESIWGCVIGRLGWGPGTRRQGIGWRERVELN